MTNDAHATPRRMPSPVRGSFSALPRYFAECVLSDMAKNEAYFSYSLLELRDGVKNDRRLLFGDKRTLPFGVYAGSDSISIRRVDLAPDFAQIPSDRVGGNASPPCRGSWRTA